MLDASKRSLTLIFFFYFKYTRTRKCYFTFLLADVCAWKKRKKTLPLECALCAFHVFLLIIVCGCELCCWQGNLFKCSCDRMKNFLIRLDVDMKILKTRFFCWDFYCVMTRSYKFLKSWAIQCLKIKES